MLSRCFSRNRTVSRHAKTWHGASSRSVAHQAPIFRLLSSESSSSPSSASSKQRSGGIFIGLGWALLGLVAIDQGLQYRQEQEAKDHFRTLVLMQKEADDQNQADWDTSLPAIFSCKVMHVEHSLDGTKIVKNIRLGDVVEVMEAGVGPHQAYHLCRIPSSKRGRESIGWYPSKYLERVDA